MIGKEINNYKIESLLGQGGMGSVYKVIHSVLKRKAALKLLHFNFSENPKVLERFKNEALTLDDLKHEAIVQLIDYGKFENRPFLLLEYIEGVPLDDYIKKISGPIPEERALELLFQMLEGINYAHKKTVVHRDIKPSNFMLTPDGKIKILDFGIAKILSDNNMNMTKEGQKIGTIPYMSPEQIQGKIIDTRSDIYSLGVTFFQMLTGQEPYEQALTEWDISNKIVFEPLPKANLIYPHISESMQHLIDKATAKNKEERFQTCEEFLKEVHDLLPTKKEKHILPEAKKDLVKAKKEYADLFEVFYEDKNISNSERELLKKKQAELSLSSLEISEIESFIVLKYSKKEKQPIKLDNTKKIEQLVVNENNVNFKKSNENSIRKRKKVITFVAGFIFILFIGIVLFSIFSKKNQNIDYESVDFKTQYIGKMEIEGSEVSIRLKINEVKPDWTIYYDFYLKAEQKLSNKQARINTKTNEITFLLKGANDSEKEVIKILNIADISKNKSDKIVLTSRNKNWELSQLIQK